MENNSTPINSYPLTDKEHVSDEALALVYSSQKSEEAIAELIRRFDGMMNVNVDRFKDVPAIDLIDLKQEATLGLVKAAAEFKAESGVPFFGFASRCIRNKILDAVRAYLRIKNIAFNEAVSITDDDGSDNERIPDISVIDPLHAYAQKEFVDNFYALAKDNLPQRQFIALTMSLNDYSYKEIMEELELDNLKQVDNAIAAAKRTMRKLL